MSKYDAFLICPVRNATEIEKGYLNYLIEHKEGEGLTIYYPTRDTDQNDHYGLRICADNKLAMMNSEEVWVYWNKESKGSLFDLGMAFAFDKKVWIINPESLELSEVKSFDNMLSEWEMMSI
jgi:hypothetical protein